MQQIGTDVARAASVLRSGGLVGMPTETVYGLAANALDEVAVARIFEAKNRPHFDPLIVHLADWNDVDRVAAQVPAEARALWKALGPAALTYVVPKRAEVPDLVTAGLDQVAVRVPELALARQLIASAGVPVAAPSANPFGFVSPTTAQHVADQLAGKVDYILDGGACSVGVESTIVSWADGGAAVVLRLGGVPLEVVSDVLGYVPEVRLSSSRPSAPGMLDAHYAPGKPVHLVPHGFDWSSVELKQGIQYLAWKPGDHGVPSLTTNGSSSQGAQRLFAALRVFAASGDRELWMELAPEAGLGRAVNDRLRRAAHRGEG
ncbi:MAG: Threonylcarbamoyl-AMP synthase [Bacteroidota bacterium]|jgi:L-threonylcarbamoyladenylate synthase